VFQEKVCVLRVKRKDSWSGAGEDLTLGSATQRAVRVRGGRGKTNKLSAEGRVNISDGVGGGR